MEGRNDLFPFTLLQRVSNRTQSMAVNNCARSPSTRRRLLVEARLMELAMATPRRQSIQFS